MDGPIRAEEDRALVHPHAVFRSRVSLARLLQEEASGQSGNFSFFFFSKIFILVKCGRISNYCVFF